MKYDRAEAVRYMGAKKDDNEAAVLADLAYLQLRNEVRPRSCWQIFACRVDDAGVTLVDNGMRFESKNLAGHLQGCQKAAVLAATLGSNADTVLRRLALTNVAQAAAAQAVCAALIESYCDETEAEIAAAADLIVGPIGIIIPNAMMGEITPRIAEAVGSAAAKKVLLPVSQNHFEIVGVEPKSLASLVKEAVSRILTLVEA